MAEFGRLWLGRLAWATVVVNEEDTVGTVDRVATPTLPDTACASDVAKLSGPWLDPLDLAAADVKERARSALWIGYRHWRSRILSVCQMRRTEKR